MKRPTSFLSAELGLPDGLGDELDVEARRVRCWRRRGDWDQGRVHEIGWTTLTVESAPTERNPSACGLLVDEPAIPGSVLISRVPSGP